MPVLGGSWALTSRVMSTVAMVITLSPLFSTHEPSSRVKKPTGKAGACKCKWRPFCHGVDVAVKSGAKLACRPNLGHLNATATESKWSRV